MKRDVLIYGLIGGVLIAVLKLTEYRFLVIEHSLEIYGGLVALTFAAVGIWLGRKLSRPHATEKNDAAIVIQQVPVPAPSPLVPDAGKRDALGLTRRELEILESMAEGLSNREIADKLFVSENTVKTHASRVLAKLGAKRRTHAVQLGKEFGLLR